MKYLLFILIILMCGSTKAETIVIQVKTNGNYKIAQTSTTLMPTINRLINLSKQYKQTTVIVSGSKSNSEYIDSLVDAIKRKKELYGVRIAMAIES